MSERPLAEKPPPPPIRYARTSDGVRIAFFTLGEGPPLVHSPAFPLSHLRLEWGLSAARRYLGALSRTRKVIRYDCRGAGLSDREVNDFSLEAQIRDLEAVVEQLRLDRFALFAFGHQAPASIAYAARHPERVTHLILWRAYAKSSEFSSSERVQTAWSMIDRDWEMYTAMEGYRATEFQGGPAALWFTNYMRETITPANLKASYEALSGIDVTAHLGEVRCPTLVMHRTGSHVLNVSAARNLAARIPNAELALLDGPWLMPFSGDANAVIELVERFLGGSSAPSLLTPREGEILELLAKGLSSREIGETLTLSVRTVERHITNIYGKIGAHSRSQATAYAFEHGLVKPS